ncbi:MAG: DUF421 domain-containing protein [Vicinamibacteraceae bacterium]
MELVLRATTTYALLLVIFRISGKRSLAQITTFDFVWLLIISEATQQALIGNDASVTGSAIVVGTLVLIDLCLSGLKNRYPAVDRILDSTPLVIIDNGRIHHDRMRRERISLDDVEAAARIHANIEGLDQIKYAIVERSGGISIIPR